MPPVIGVFDSGFGGLTVLRELLAVLPGADYLYFGDTARLPYGSKSAHTVAKYAISSAHFLQERGAEMLVIACNTATALALDEIKSSITLPVIGVVDPGAQRAAEISRSRKAAVIATEATVASHAYEKALRACGIQSVEKACPLLVPLVEEGWVDHPVTEQVAHIYVDEVFGNGADGADVLVLGCTHYPLLRPLLRRVVPAQVQIVDSAESTAQAVAAFLNVPASGSAGALPGTLHCYATDSVEKFRRLGGRFLGRPIENIELVDIER
jgi:glutamate racemase